MARMKRAVGKVSFFGFLVAGGLATVVNFSMFVALVGYRTDYQLAAVIGYFSGTAVSYAVNRYVVFASSRPGLPQLARFVLLDIAGIGTQLLVLEGFLSLGLGIAASNGAAIIVVVLAKYLVARRFVFGRAFEGNRQQGREISGGRSTQSGSRKP
jgi:putative flippase GtrA